MNKKQKISEIKKELEKLNLAIYEDWKSVKWVKYFDRATDQYINGGYKGFEVQSELCQARDKRLAELRELEPVKPAKPLTYKQKIRQEENYMKNCGLLKTSQQRNQWRLTKQGLINTNELMKESNF